MNNKTDIDVRYVSPLKKICMTIGELPASYLETMSYYEMLVWFVEFLKNQVIPTVNNNAEAVSELQALYEELRKYVNNYFDNLDVQDEINNKLEAMAESGQLTDIIAQYLGLAGMFVFDTVADMKAAENLVNGSKCQTLGYSSVNDNGGAIYKVRTVTNNDVIDEGSIIALNDENLVAELIVIKDVNVLNFGYEIEDITYNNVTYSCKNVTDAINNAITYLGNKKGIQIFFPDDTYLIDETITLTDKLVGFYGNSLLVKTVDYNIGNFKQKIFTNINGSVFTGGKCTVKGLNFMNILETNENTAIFSTNCIEDASQCHINNYDTVFSSLGGVAMVKNNYFLNCRKYFVNGNLSDSIVTDNYINANPSAAETICFNSSTVGMSLISGNFIDFFKKAIVISTQATGDRIVDNTFDYIYKAIDVGGATGLTISNNSFNHISNTYYERLGYQSTDPEATSAWICIETRSTIRGLSITGNTIENVDKFINIPSVDGNSSITCINNIIGDYSKYGTFAAGVNNNKLKFYDLNEKEYSVEPTKWNTYLNQIAYYNGFIYKNIGNIVKCIGTTQLIPSVSKNYTAAGGGNTTIDFTNCLSSGILSDVQIQVRTTRAYYTPQTAIFSISRIGNSLVITELFNNSDANYKINASASGLTLTISFSGTVESDTSASKQVVITNYLN